MRVLHILDHSLPHHSGYAIRSHNILRFQKQQNFEPVVLTSPKHISGFDWGADRFDEIEYLHSTNSVNPYLEEMSLMRSLTKAIKVQVDRIHPEIIHAHSPLLNGWPAYFVSKRLAIPLVYEVRAFWEDAAVDHGTAQTDSAKYKITKRLETMLMRRAAQVVTLSQTMRSEIISRGIPENKVHVVPNAVDANRFQPTPASEALIEKYNLRSCKVIGFVGSFYHYEGLDLLIRAFEKAYQKNQAVRLLLVGDGFEFDAMKRQANASPATAGICLTGRVDYSKVLDYYSLLDMAVFPRYKMRLTELVCPLKPLEAMAMEKPVIGSDVGGIREFIRHEEAGLLFKSGDVDELAGAILKLCESPDICRVLGREGRKMVFENWHWPVVVKRYHKIYQLAKQVRNGRNGVLA